ncbi:MAG TPA: hypothetical protein VE967_14705 [Gemmatimonadaceae bacterium]|nr:hypothetical protein [Gemmatimonadaceae bacterium]
MNVSRDVIIDLLPLYASGEASAATQELVREYLAHDPGLAELVRQQNGTSDSARITVPPDLEAKSFRRTKRRLALQRWAFGLAWLFTAVSLGIRIQSDGGRVTSVRLLLQDAPLQFGTLGLLAVISWVTYFSLRRKT